MVHSNLTLQHEQYIDQKLQQGTTLRAVSDGSNYPLFQQGPSAWIIQADDPVKIAS